MSVSNLVADGPILVGSLYGTDISGSHRLVGMQTRGVFFKLGFDGLQTRILGFDYVSPAGGL